MKRILLYLFLGSFAALMAYANLRHVNPSASLEPVDVRTFEVTNLENTQPDILKQWILQNKHVKAVSINEEWSLIGVTYQCNRMSEPELLKHVSMNGVLDVSKKVFSKSDKPGCPVHGALVVWERLLNFLRWESPK